MTKLLAINNNQIIMCSLSSHYKFMLSNLYFWCTGSLDVRINLRHTIPDMSANARTIHDLFYQVLFCPKTAHVNQYIYRIYIEIASYTKLRLPP